MVSGTPGIGKSCFLTFLMLYLSKSTNVAYKYSSSVYYYDRKSSCCSLFYPFDYNFPGSENCVFLCDVSDTSFPLFTKLSFDCHAVFVSSPDQSKHKILKPFLSKSTYYLPLWTIDEMLNCRKVISHNLDDMEWKLRVERGGDTKDYIGRWRNLYGDQRSCFLTYMAVRTTDINTRGQLTYARLLI